MPARKAKARSGELGCFATYSHPDDFHDGGLVMRTALKKRPGRPDGLAEFIELFPDTRSELHRFQSACRSVESARGKGPVEIDVREVINDNSECVYQITRRVIDRKEKVVEYEKSMTLAFNKGFATIDVRQLDDYDALRGLEDSIREHYKTNAKTVPGQKIRNAIRDVILAIGGQNFRGKAGGLYFVPEQYPVRGSNPIKMAPTLPVLDALADLIDELYGERGELFVIPAPDDDYMRQVVSRHFTINAKDESAALLERVVNRVRAGAGKRGLRDDFYSAVLNDSRRLGFALDQFDEMVGIERKEIERNLHDIEHAIGDLEQLRGPATKK